MPKSRTRNTTERQDRLLRKRLVTDSEEKIEKHTDSELLKMRCVMHDARNLIMLLKESLNTIKIAKKTEPILNNMHDTLKSLEYLLDADYKKNKVSTTTLQKELERSVKRLRIYFPLQTISLRIHSNKNIRINETKAALLVRCLLNLIQNSIEAEASSIIIVLSSKYKKVYLSVSDNGSGFSKEMLKKATSYGISTKAQTDNNEGGVGLFSVASLVLAEFGGEVQIKNLNRNNDIRGAYITLVLDSKRLLS
ncbi:ATP-binding protein [Candidatus Nomurabacteria bacterium]|uniref:histidine kinase n=1 Tax=candidate division WWE3 bacterium TaxID=2053526 RepID=A0A955E1F8_UNCKA|nr:ATP-binding protein [candidate division WWE3 bacterium]MCB9823433.1 ATP-binding protein [Candidatus Nomurabacteria bacterium]MCB9827715.1 ATP-binding protein [Candidatus Nomurabacteria bacterium]HXK52661.1 ATP-binding protein [bacterium]